MSDKRKYVLVVCPNPSIDIFAWVENFNIGEPNRILKEEKYPGGKGIHVAMALAEADIDVVVLGFWGSMPGEWIKNECKKYYPKIKFEGPVLEDWTRSCYTFKTTEESGFDETEILGPGPLLTREHIGSFYEYFEKLVPKATAVALSGSWPKGSPDNGYKKLIAAAKKFNVPSFLDCTGAQLKNALDEHPYCVHLNKNEVTTYFDTTNFQEAKEKLVEFCDVAAVTDGAKGLHYFTKDVAVQTLSKVDKVISAIGSGDCLLAGIVAGYLKNLDPTETAKLGAAFGAANCMRKELGMLFREDVQKLFESAVVIDT